MGFMRWMARWGNVGGTARWAAKKYKFFRHRHPDKEKFPDAAIYRLMIVTRYETIPDQQTEDFLLSVSENLNGLRALVVAILNQEANFTENDIDVQQMCLSIIDEELEKKGLTHETIHGKF